MPICLYFSMFFHIYIRLRAFCAHHVDQNNYIPVGPDNLTTAPTLDTGYRIPNARSFSARAAVTATAYATITFQTRGTALAYNETQAEAGSGTLACGACHLDREMGR